MRYNLKNLCDSFRFAFYNYMVSLRDDESVMLKLVEIDAFRPTIRVNKREQG